MNRLGIATGGERRLREAIETEAQREYEKELAAAVGYWQRAAIKLKIREVLEERLKRTASPYSLWISKLAE